MLFGKAVSMLISLGDIYKKHAQPLKLCLLQEPADSLD